MEDEPGGLLFHRTMEHQKRSNPPTHDTLECGAREISRSSRYYTAINRGFTVAPGSTAAAVPLVIDMGKHRANKNERNQNAGGKVHESNCQLKVVVNSKL